MENKPAVQPIKMKEYVFSYDNTFRILVKAKDEDNARLKVISGIDCIIEVNTKQLDLSKLKLQATEV